MSYLSIHTVYIPAVPYVYVPCIVCILFRPLQLSSCWASSRRSARWSMSAWPVMKLSQPGLRLLNSLSRAQWPRHSPTTVLCLLAGHSSKFFIGVICTTINCSGTCYTLTFVTFSKAPRAYVGVFNWHTCPTHGMIAKWLGPSQPIHVLQPWDHWDFEVEELKC